MPPKTIGIIGGAGPLAGAQLLDRILSLCISKYRCFKDADFPRIVLISFPFSEMLTRDADAAQLSNELQENLAQLRKQGAAVLAIACNTLHAFLNKEDEITDLVHLPRMFASDDFEAPPLVLCTSTAVRYALHRKFFACIYPDATTQEEIDAIIDLILKGASRDEVVETLSRIIETQEANTIVLGCTELSLVSKELQSDKRLIDPLERLANQILEKSFSQGEAL